MFYVSLQFISPSGSGHALALLALLGNLASWLPLQRLKPLRKDRVGEVVAREDPVGIHGAEVLDLELDQGLRELGAVAEAAGEGVRLELEAAA